MAAPPRMIFIKIPLFYPFQHYSSQHPEQHKRKSVKNDINCKCCCQTFISLNLYKEHFRNQIKEMTKKVQLKKMQDKNNLLNNNRTKCPDNGNVQNVIKSKRGTKKLDKISKKPLANETIGTQNNFTTLKSLKIVLKKLPQNFQSLSLDELTRFLSKDEEVVKLTPKEEYKMIFKTEDLAEFEIVINEVDVGTFIDERTRREANSH